MSDLAEAGSRAPQLLRDRDRSGAHRVTNIELFFDLVYVFAVTQLSHYLLHHATVTGALQAGLLLWLGSVGIDLLGGVAGFWTPGLGRSRTSDWTIEGGHFAERCQAFILIALGESIVIIGATLSEVKVTTAAVTSFVVAFAGA